MSKKKLILVSLRSVCLGIVAGAVSHGLKDTAIVAVFLVLAHAIGDEL